MVAADPFDARLRAAASDWLARRELELGPVRYEDVSDFTFEGRRIPLLDPQRGIRKPRGLEAALSIRTVYAERPDQRPYDDRSGPDGYERYKWRGTDAGHPENRALRAAMRDELPLIWFLGIGSGRYQPVHPVWLIAEEPDQHQFVVAVDGEQVSRWNTTPVSPELIRAHAARIVWNRVHQPLFRARVLDAYDRHCAVCGLPYAELLDAAHIRSDAAGGEPVVPNGIALCKIHHGAYDTNILGIDSDHRIFIRPDVLTKSDGPTLKHALQGFHGSLLTIPTRKRAQPDPALLAERFERFQRPDGLLPEGGGYG